MDNPITREQQYSPGVYALFAETTVRVSVRLQYSRDELMSQNSSGMPPHRPKIPHKNHDRGSQGHNNITWMDAGYP